MDKRMGTYRVRRDLLAAVAAKCAQRGETVTHLIIERFESYIRDDEAPPIASAPPVSAPSVYTPVESPESYEEPPAAPSCRHPAVSVDELGTCRECGADVW